MAVNLSGGAGEDLKKMMAEHHLMQKEDLSNQGISQDVTYLKQAEHLMRTTNYSCAVKYTVKALEFNPDSKVLFMDSLQCITVRQRTLNHTRFSC